MLESLDSLIAAIAIVFVLSLIVQAVQQILKQLLCMKSAYMERELVMMFLTDGRLRSLAAQRKKILNKIKPQWCVLRKIPEGEKLVVKDLKIKMQSIGYRDLEILENLSVDTFIDILRTLPMFSKFERETVDKLRDVEYEARKWFDIAKRAFQDHYERRMKLWAFILSGIVVLALNANIFSIFKQLSTNKVLRESIVASVPTLLSIASDSAHVDVSDAIRDSIIKHQVGTIESYISDKSLTLVRWNSANGDSLSGTLSPFAEKNFWKDFCKAAGKNWLGWLGMTLLVSLGAPFWYDTLRAIMGVKNKLRAGVVQEPKPEQEPPDTESNHNDGRTPPFG